MILIKGDFTMENNYYFEFDCYTLNKKSRLHYPFPLRLADKFKNLLFRNNSHTLLGPEGLTIDKMAQKIKNIEARVSWDQKLQETSYVVFDCETTGLQPFKGDRVISIGAVKIEHGLVRTDEIFEQLVNPERPIPKTASHITGIDDEMVVGKPNIYEALLEFLSFSGGSILVAHNAAFDLTFLNTALCRLAPLRIPNPVIDTYTLARSILPDMFEYSLERLAAKYDIQIEGRHTAVGDSLVTAELFLVLLEKINCMGINTLPQLGSFMEWQKSNEKLHKPQEGGF